VVAAELGDPVLDDHLERRSVWRTEPPEPHEFDGVARARRQTSKRAAEREAPAPSPPSSALGLALGLAHGFEFPSGALVLGVSTLLS
jgi:hypothetical protein